MGYGSYSSTSRAKRAFTSGFHTKSQAELFRQRNINSAMDPHGVLLRESRDSEQHPNSLAIDLGLDVTGSMGSVPHYLVREGLPHIMEKLMKAGIPDPQILFTGIGDHFVDHAPFQIGQYESGDELLDHWLTTLWLEGGGGRGDAESYLIHWYFAAFHTVIDCLEKRGKKGYLITIGDEPTHRVFSAAHQQAIFGPGQYQDYTAAELLDAAQEKYHVYHIHIMETRSGSRTSVQDFWREFLADHVKFAQRREEVATIIVDIILSGEAAAPTATPITSQGQQGSKEPEMML